MNQRPDLAAVMPAVARALLGDPNRRLSTATDWRYGSKGSLSIDPEGGVWFSHEDGDGGGVLDLIRRERKCGVGEALAWLEQIGEHVPPVRDSTPRPINRADWREPALKLWGEARPLANTAGAAYLSARGVSAPADAPMRFHPRAPFGKDEASQRVYRPCIVSLMRSVSDGRPMGVHRIALGPSGHLGKKMLGPVEGAAVMLRPLDVGDARLGVCEGIETGLAILELGWQHALYALGSAGKIARLPVLHGIDELTVFADNDRPSKRYGDPGGEGVAAAHTLGRAWADTGTRVLLRVPPEPGTDFLDMLNAEEASDHAA